MIRLADVGTSIDSTAFVAVMAALLVLAAWASIRDARATCDAIERQDHAAAISAGGPCPWCGGRS